LSPTNNPSTTYFDVPWNLSWLLNWRKQKFSATFSMSLAEGSGYGGPLDIIGIDPRTCGSNSSSATRTVFDPTTGAPTTVPVTPITSLSPATDPFKCDSLTAVGTLSNAAGQLYVPNPQTGSFALPGQYRNPWIMVGNLGLTYDVSPRISANVTLANIFHTCFGGTGAPWTTAYGPSPNVCGYAPAGPATTGVYVSNFFNGTSPNDVAANGVAPRPWQTQSYLPDQTFGNAAGFIPNPFTAFFQLTVKI
jgi:hypothetical protein